MIRLKLAVAFAAALVLVACKDSSAPAAAAGTAAAAKTESSAVSVPVIEAEARGITVGSPMSARTVYVFFDPQCPHCAALWQAAKPLKAQAKFVWIPVRLLNNTSQTQGAALLAAKDPVAAMDEHETAILANQKGEVPGDGEAQKETVTKNTALFNRFGFQSVPTIVAQNAQTGALVSHEGALPTADLAALLGLQAPSPAK
ncbi:MAG: dsbG [Ramlibacter sp.]|nr:dsbG [Ramlibacter sp.]